MNEINLEKLQKLKDNLPYFARNFLIIKSKTQGKIPLNLNPIQMDFHNLIEIRKSKKLPAKYVVVKARQLGLSTYIEARLFHKTIFNKAKNAFILGDKADTSASIFDMARRYYDELPSALQISLKRNSTRALEFSTDSLFRVGTAGSDVIGRGTTNNYFHGSEVGFWKNAQEVVSGILQTIPEDLDSEIFLESTTNGVSGDGRYFYEMANIGLEEKSEFKTIFYPWFKNPEYQKEVIEPIKYDDYEKFLIETYSLSQEQIAWRRNKLENEFKGREYLFKQEYPASLAEAFLKNDNSLIPVEYLEKARKNTGLSSMGLPIIIGVDPARSQDRTVITIRQGRILRKIYKFEKMDNVRLAGIIAQLIAHLKPKRVFIDYGHGTGVYDILVSQGLSSFVELVQFGSSAFDNTKYANRRAEMFDKMRDWFMQDGGVYIEDSEHHDELIRDLSIIPDLKVSDSNGRYSLEKKENIIKGTKIHSTDFADSLALTFAAPVGYVTNGGFGFDNQVKTINDNWQQRL